jgi:serine/threonine protein kinase
MGAFGLVCSAKDQLTSTSVAIKKIMKPFSTPVLSKRTYRELKLLKHIRHENVSGKERSLSGDFSLSLSFFPLMISANITTITFSDYFSVRHLHLSTRGYVR